MLRTLLVVSSAFLFAIHPASAEPISSFIGLTALIAGGLGTSAAIGGLASMVGGAVVGGAMVFRRRN